jgi:2-polyprenyl-3-methyl-5-hydroxy-6-metoxy-1,4-benzoquinol methylase
VTGASVAPPRDTPAGPVSPAAAAARVLAFGRQGFSRRRGYGNIASPLGVAQYTAIAAEVAGRIGTGRVLDWGAGWGQNSLLLHTRGARVTAYDVEDKGAADGLLAGTGIRYVVSAAAGLPFADGEFDAVLNCGVLEHVADERAALAELRRVLRPRGLLFTYHLPNRLAWTEWLGRQLGRFHHERTYTRDEARGLFEAAGFRVVAQEPFHLLPRNAWAQLPSWLTPGERAARTLTAAEAALVRLPGLARFSTAWSLLAERT